MGVAIRRREHPKPTLWFVVPGLVVMSLLIYWYQDVTRDEATAADGLVWDTAAPSLNLAAVRRIDHPGYAVPLSEAPQVQAVLRHFPDFGGARRAAADHPPRLPSPRLALVLHLRSGETVHLEVSDSWWWVRRSPRGPLVSGPFPVKAGTIAAINAAWTTSPTP